MADVQLENGYTRTANQLLDAIITTDFTKRQLKILKLVIRMSFGCGKTSALFRLGDFEVAGIYKSDIRKELQELFRLKVLGGKVEGELIRIWLIKDFEKWGIQPQCDSLKWERLLNRNLEDEVGKSLTVSKIQTTEPFKNHEVSKTLTEDVGKIPTLEDGSLQNTNYKVGEILTTVSGKLNTDSTLEPPKESKERSFTYINDQEKKKGVRGKKRKRPPDNRTIEEVVSQFKRYSLNQVDVILKYWDVIRLTRKTENIANSVIESTMEYWEKFDIDIVIESLDIHRRKYPERREEYTLGIMRGKRDEQERKMKENGGASSNRASPSSGTGGISNLIIRAEEESERIDQDLYSLRQESRAS